MFVLHENILVNLDNVVDLYPCKDGDRRSCICYTTNSKEEYFLVFKDEYRRDKAFELIILRLNSDCKLLKL